MAASAFQQGEGAQGQEPDGGRLGDGLELEVDGAGAGGEVADGVTGRAKS